MPTTLLLNRSLVTTAWPQGSTLLDFVRYGERLPGAKIGCREGDCGACAMLVGSLVGGRVVYESVTSCLMPLGNAHGKHIVTVEGLNGEALTPVQHAMVECSASQCGFCTVGFILSLTGFALSGEPATRTAGAAAIDGNICRCTGYKSIVRAVGQIAAHLADRPKVDSLAWLVEQGYVPEYFLEVPGTLARIEPVETRADDGKADGTNGQLRDSGNDHLPTVLGGGTDLIVQQADEISARAVNLVYGRDERRGIALDGDIVRIGAAATMTDVMQSPVLNELFPAMSEWMKLVASTPIRNMATLAGNLVNASPIGDMTCLLLALDSALILIDGEHTRDVPLREFYLDYKKTALRPGEQVEAIQFAAPRPGEHFHFEKVSKRRNLDIASVNTAARIAVEGGVIRSVILSGGGVGPTPRQLPTVMAALEDRPLNPEPVRAALTHLGEDIAPISDARGSAEYKRLLLRQLILAHFITLFPDSMTLEALA